MRLLWGGDRLLWGGQGLFWGAPPPTPPVTPPPTGGTSPPTPPEPPATIVDGRLTALPLIRQIAIDAEIEFWPLFWQGEVSGAGIAAQVQGGDTLRTAAQPNRLRSELVAIVARAPTWLEAEEVRLKMLQGIRDSGRMMDASDAQDGYDDAGKVFERRFDVRLRK